MSRKQIKKDLRMDRLRRFFGVGSETHRQVYNAWKEYPLAMKHACMIMFCVGVCFSSWFWILAKLL